MKNIQKKDNKSSGHIRNPFISIQKELDKALHGFYDLFESKPFNLKEFEDVSLAPFMDLVEDDKCYKVEVEMPGMDENDIQVSFNNNVLTIHGEKSTSKKDERKNYIAREINYGQYDRSILLPHAADSDKATATFKKGMLWITIPKKAGTTGNGRQIKVQKVE